MPIRVQNDLPVKEILEKENIFVMDEAPGEPGHPSPGDRDLKPDAAKGGYGAAASTGNVQHSPAGKLYFPHGFQP